jgi:ASC-1-like (ASCH) protein
MILSKLESIISGQKELKVRVDQIRETNNNNKNDDVSLNQEFIKVFIIKLYVFKLYG